MLKCSVVTPSHDTRYLVELHDTLRTQTYNNWEWVLYLNGDACGKGRSLPQQILDDSRITVWEEPGNGLVGSIKKAAFSKATGDVLVEVDHDDLLTADCLAEIMDGFADPKVGFVYSDIAKLSDDFTPYRKELGWTYRSFDWGEKQLIAMNSFPPDAGSLAFIWYSPDHVRAWRREVYEKVGGHNEDLSILDDQDLMCRTYLHTKFHYVQKVLYVYRITGENTWLKRNKQIQEGTVRMYHEYAHALAERDCELAGLMKIDLGGGLHPRPGYSTIDLEGGDISWDLNNGIPLNNNSVGVLNASHILEHLRNPVHIMAEIHRVLCDGGWAMIEVPSTDGRGAFQDPTHVSFWNENSFWYYTQKKQAEFIRNTTTRFQAYRNETMYPSQWWKDARIPVVRAYLRAIKSNKNRPHGCYI